MHRLNGGPFFNKVQSAWRASKEQFHVLEAASDNSFVGI